MKDKGQVFKFIGTYGLIRPDEWGQTRRDVLFNKKDYNLKLGDRVLFDSEEKNGRRFAINLENE